MVETIFSTPLAQVALIFVLVFTVVFAVLQKSGVLGKEKRQIDALVSLAIGLIIISVGYAIAIISNLIPFLAVSLIVIFVFMVLMGAFFKDGDFKLPKGVETTGVVLAFVAVVIAVLYFTGAWQSLQELFISDVSNLVANVIIVVVVIVALAAVIFGGKKGGDKKD
ncbi:hypothetical protein COU54_04635 [Candidatus Pacearchaeota archaeon CG10_big_fil_rev_8_21_14_0_10_31_24]|nr:MAG: hypothetical protein COU54_04635 [Candidatus Pacearchaeota archaeon CG10_big_fil_rev_8_21_14_0_10_31_24]